MAPDDRYTGARSAVRLTSIILVIVCLGFSATALGASLEHYSETEGGVLYNRSRIDGWAFAKAILGLIAGVFLWSAGKLLAAGPMSMEPPGSEDDGAAASDVPDKARD
jgi:hypothetical protein